MARQRLPEAFPISFKLQPMFHKDIIDYVVTIPVKERSEHFRAALRIIRDHPQLLEQYLAEPPAPPQMELDELLKTKTG